MSGAGRLRVGIDAPTEADKVRGDTLLEKMQR